MILTSDERGKSMIIKANKASSIAVAVLFLFVAAMMVFAGAMIFLDIPTSEDSPIVIAAAGVLVLCFAVLFLLCSIYYFRESRANKPLIEITDTYFCDNSSAIAFGEIVWSDMERVYLKGLFLCIKLRDPDVYLSRKNVLSRFLIGINRRLGYGDACINPHQRFPKEAESFFREFFRRRGLDTPKN